MQRRTFLLGAAGGLARRSLAQPPSAPSRLAPIAEPHFPDRLHQFVWRNWELVDAGRMAGVAGCRPGQILAIGRSMGLPPKPPVSPDQLRRVYVTVIRQNWHLLPDEQLIRLLGWTPERFEFTLKEDDFLDVKLGPKPDCPRLTYRHPNREAKRCAAEICRTLRTYLGSELDREGDPPFQFIQRLSDLTFPSLRDPAARAAAGQVDVTGWSIETEGPVEARLTERFAAYLRTAMEAPPARSSAKRVVFRIDSALSTAPEAFRVAVEDSRVEVAANSAAALWQAVNWLQDQMEENGGPFLARGRTERRSVFHPRYLYSYFALYGDPLLEPDLDPFPDGYLEKLSRAGINGVWMQCVLQTMVPSRLFPEFGQGSEARLSNLSRLVERAGRCGLKVYLYLNEPRAMPAAFYHERPEMKGAASRGLYAVCTSVSAVRRWISDSVAHIFAQVPGLGGVFSITMSENFTNCFSRSHPESCPRCSQRKDWEVVGEVLEAIRSGVRRSSSQAEVIVWDWGWPEEMARRLIPKLPPDTRLLSVSEWSIPIERGGVKAQVGEYSISVVGPGPRAIAHWALAKAAGVPAMAKTQFNNTWEISAVPYIPVANLIAQHCANLTKAGVGGLMASWTLGGYPSPNLEIAREFYFSPAESPERILERVAVRRYGQAAAPLALEAWKGFSEAFQEFPYGAALYVLPMQYGPANLLRARPTGVKSSMILFPQDDYQAWAGRYPPHVVRDQCAKMAARWEQALPAFRCAVERVPAAKKARALEDLAIAETCYVHFRSVANQVEFYLLRDSPPAGRNPARLRELVAGELELARRLYSLARRHSVIAYEASNHYYYRPLDLAEKILHCRYLLDHATIIAEGGAK